VAAGPHAASNMTVTRFRSSHKLAVDAPDADTRVQSKPKSWRPGRRGSRGAFCGRGFSDAPLIGRCLSVLQGANYLFLNFFGLASLSRPP
jgi:hypothetical protein